ncbi:MAG: TadE/TadG family type IV pilus assembly protein [Dehalococcoidia bacterium]
MEARGVRRRSRLAVFRGKSRGQSLVEFAMIAPLFFILVLGIVDFGMGLHSWMTMTNATREGARLAAVHAPSSGSVDCNPLPAEGSIERKVCDTATNLDADAMTITVTNADPEGDNAGEEVSVQIDYDYELIMPLSGFMDLSTISLSATTKMRLE